MSAIVDRLLREVAPDAPCGANLEYDPEFVALAAAATATPQRAIGNTVFAGEEPDWHSVAARARDLLERSKDLRVAIHLARALLNVEGFAGFRDALEVLRGLTERYWEAVHPHLDPEDDYDPTTRTNTLSALADQGSFLADLRRTPLVSSRGFGKVSYRDVLIINGELAPADANEIGTPDAVGVKAAFLECEESELRTVAQAVNESIAHLAAITTQLNNCIGEQLCPNLKPLAGTLDGIGRLLKEKMVQRGVDQPAAAINVTPPKVVVAESGASTPAASGEIANREDVVRVIDHLCAYYERCEPSSPVPLLLRRAKRLVSKSFFEILNDLTPDGVARAEMIFGAEQREGGS